MQLGLSQPVRLFFTKLNSTLQSRHARLLLLLLLALVYTVAYRFYPLCPGNKPAHPLGWWEWADQSLYLKSAYALAHGSLSPDAHHYYLGYPVLGALFARWMPTHPFFFPNLLAVLGAATAWWWIARRLLSPVQTLVFTLAFVGLHASLIAQTNIIPWNTLPVQCALLTGIGIALKPANTRAVIHLSLLAAGTYLIRPVDSLSFAPLLVFSVLRLPAWKTRFTYGAVGITILTAAALVVGGINDTIYGTPQTPYERLSMQQIGFFSYPVLQKAFLLLVDQHVFFCEKTPGLLFRYPWLLLAIPGSIFWIRKEKAGAVAGLLTVGLNWTLYLNYNDFLPSDIYRYHLIHYLVWSFPLLALLATAACLQGWRDRVVQTGFVMSLLVFVFIFGIQLKECPLPSSAQDAQGWIIPKDRPLVVRFTGIPSTNSDPVKIDNQPAWEYMHYLKPEVREADLQFWLGTKAPGRHFTLIGNITTRPDLARYTWDWAITRQRLDTLLHR